MDNTPRILIVDRDRIAGQAMKLKLAELGYASIVVRSDTEAIDQLDRANATADAPPFGVVLADQDAQGMGGEIGLIRRLHQDWPAIVPIVVSGFRKVESAVLAMRLGAADYLLKPVAEHEFADAVHRAVQRYLLQFERETAQQPVQPGEEQTEARRECAVDLSGVEDGDWSPMPLSQAMQEPEKRILLAALKANDWNRGQTARQLDINRTTLYKKIRQYRLDEPA